MLDPPDAGLKFCAKFFWEREYFCQKKLFRSARLSQMLQFPIEYKKLVGWIGDSAVALLCYMASVPVSHLDFLTSTSASPRNYFPMCNALHYELIFSSWNFDLYRKLKVNIISITKMRAVLYSYMQYKNLSCTNFFDTLFF